MHVSYLAPNLDLSRQHVFDVYACNIEAIGQAMRGLPRADNILAEHIPNERVD